MNIRKLFISVFCLFLILFLTACSSGFESSSDKGSAEMAGDVSTDDGASDNGSNQIQAGQLTACAYDDNEHYDFWKSLLSADQDGKGYFKSHHDNFAFTTDTRIEITVPSGLYFKISLLDENDNPIYSSDNDANGKCYLYAPTFKENYKVSFEYYEEGKIVATKIVKTIGQSFELTDEIVQQEKEDVIQLMFVIDTTGSMGDELNYLKAEIIDIIEKVKEEIPNTKIELAIMVYRDYRDSYVTKYSDFTIDIASQIDFLNPIRAGGGGDFEEAVSTAMLEASQKGWNENAKTKLLFHVADAPAHNEDVSDWNKAVLDLSSKGVRIITVASSGINKKTEYFFRSQSMITQGKYVYLTDDSGIGHDHLEPTIEGNPTVEYLNMCLIRLIKGYHTGIFEEPIEYTQIQK